MGKRTNTEKSLVTNSDMNRSCERNMSKLKCKELPYRPGQTIRTSGGFQDFKKIDT
jgi:hypothetical protein